MLALFSCGGCGLYEDVYGQDPVTAEPQGSASIQFQSGECGTVPSDIHAMPTGDDPTWGSDLGEMAENTRDGAVVDCTVASADSDAIAIEALLESGNQRFRIVGTVEPVQTDTYSGSGTVEFTSPELGELASAAGSCTLAVSADQVISAGEVLADFSCPSMDGADTTSPVSQCAANGTFAFYLCRVR